MTPLPTGEDEEAETGAESLDEIDVDDFVVAPENNLLLTNTDTIDFGGKEND